MGFLRKKQTENVVISIAEYQSLQRQSAMLVAIMNANPSDRATVVEAVYRGMAPRKSGGQK